jgi:uncharacterized membrane protein
MVVPVFLAMAITPGGLANHSMMASTPAAAIFATLVHAFGYLLVTAAVALLVFEKLGVGLLRKAWLNLDLVWAVALIATGVITVLL